MAADSSTHQAKGGIARAESLTAEARSEIARKAAAARWNPGVPKATHEGVLNIDGIQIACAVLEDGRRLITQSGFMLALGRSRQAKGRAYYRGDDNLPAFLTARNLKPFIPNDLEVSSTQVEFRPLRGTRAFGYPAELLTQVCYVFIDAKLKGRLTHNQEHIANRAHILAKALATVGVTALIDEATGFQEARDRHALQAILDAYLAKELAAWAKRFPDEFYREIFRLRDWKWSRTGGKMPKLVGKLTNDIVYHRLAPELVRELERKNPRDEKGQRQSKHHQWLTSDVGHPALAQHLHATIALMRASDTWGDFRKLLDRSLPRRTKVDDLPLFSPSNAP